VSEVGQATVRAFRAAPADGAQARRPARPLTPSESAWIVLVPCALLLAAAIVVLGPPLGRALFKPGADALWPTGWWTSHGRAEPVKHGRYVLAALAPLAFAGVILAIARRPPRLGPRTIRALALAGQAGLVGLVAVAVLGQRHLILYRALDPADRRLPETFSLQDLKLAAALAVVAAILLRSRRIADRIVGWARERPLTRVAGLAIATAFAATWLIQVVASDGIFEDGGLANWTPNGAYAVLDGRTPLVDVHLIYAKLLPYPTALVLAAFGTTTLAFTIFMALLNLAALLAVYSVFRRIVGSAFAVVLFLPFVAFSDVGHWMYLAGIWPMRYGDAYLVAWLTARHLDGSSPRRGWIVFFVATVTALDTLDFGLAALLASIVALACARPPQSLRDASRLAGSVTGGALGAAAVVTVFTLVRAGEPPHVDQLFEWSRIFSSLGWFALPLPPASLHLAIYATFAAGVAVAAVRVARRADDVLLTAMLAWSGVFGLVAGNYYVARPDDVKLDAMFSAWGFTLALLTVVAVRALAARDWRSSAPAALLVLFGFALAVCTIARFPDPRGQLSRLADAQPPTYRRSVEPFIAAHTRRGEKVAILLPESYRIAYDLGLDNVAPYEMENAIVTRRQMATLIDAIEREGVTRLFTPSVGQRVLVEGEAPPAHMRAFRKAGFQRIDSRDALLAWRRADRRP